MTAVVIRPATSDDVSTITTTIRTAFEEYRGVLNPPSGSHNESEDTVAKKLAQGAGFMATVEGALAGVVLCYPEDDHLYLGRLAVLPDFRQYGVGKALANAVEAYARAQAYPYIRLGVRVQLTQNRAFFERLGYEFVAYDRHPGFEEPTFLHMQKVLSGI
jgi:ribosomal protein S18 acetylase RimI-like enzyme